MHNCFRSFQRVELLLTLKCRLLSGTIPVLHLWSWILGSETVKFWTPGGQNVNSKKSVTNYYYYYYYYYYGVTLQNLSIDVICHKSIRIPKRYRKISQKFMEEQYYLSFSTNNKCCLLHLNRYHIISQSWA